MKKFFAIFAIVLLALTLSSCLFLSTTYEDDLEFESDKNDSGVYYSALNIEVVSYYYRETKSIRYELQIGLRDLEYDPVLNEEMAISLEYELGNKLGLGLFYVGSFSVPRNYTFYSNSQSEYTYYCFELTDVPEASLIGDPYYGFFYYGSNYTLTAPSWINSLRNDMYTIMSNWLAEELSDRYPWLDNFPPLFGTLVKWSSYTIDPGAVRLRYYFGGASVEAEDAIWVDKTVLSSDNRMISCLMWQAEEIYDFTSFSLSIDKLAPGWYIIPILLGSAVVIILFLVTKNKKVDSSVFRQVDENVIESDNTVKVIDGQISMEEYQANPTENDNG